LTSNGFEVGVHDLNHDGKLFRSHQEFLQKARRINEYLRAWSAVGYRSGFMIRNLDWQQQLNIEYDATTFDTDPFEPQPDGAGTIFPFWVPRIRTAALNPNPNLDPASSRFVAPKVSAKADQLSRDGFVELPYTLVQDSTLFLLLREAGPDVWLDKLDWLADKGGMALVNVHPDYICFPGEHKSFSTFPLGHYVALLNHVRTRYATDVWHALPRDVSRHFIQSVRINTV